MKYTVYANNTEYSIIEEGLYKTIKQLGYHSKLQHFSITTGSQFTEFKDFILINNYATDGERLFILNKKAHNKLLTEKKLPQLPDLPYSKLSIFFVNETYFDTFLDVGNVTVFARVIPVNKNVRIHVPGGSVSLSINKLLNLNPSSITDLIMQVYENNFGNLHIKSEDKDVFATAAQEYPFLRLIPYEDIVHMKGKYFLYKFDGESVDIIHPTKIKNVDPFIIEGISLKQFVQLYSIV